MRVVAAVVFSAIAVAASGETLYNGIRLPAEWPPRTVRIGDAEPMRVPYLEPANIPSAIPINVGRQLFVDDFLVERLEGIERIYPKPVKYAGNPILKPETELERNLGDRNACALPKGGGVWWDPGDKVFKLWYEAGWINTVCLATSSNGIDWVRPKLDVVKGTNQVLPTDLLPDSWTVVPDFDNPDPAQRWKMFLRGPGMDLPGYSLASADGIHWKTRRLTGESLDRSSLIWNPFRRKWVFSIRSVWTYQGGWKRTRNYFETDDFLGDCLYDFKREENTKDMVLWCRTDRLDRPDPVTKFDPPQLYSVDGVAYESLMLGMFEIHHGPENHICMKKGLPKITDLCFAYSRDGFHWSRPDRNAAIRSERWGSGKWDTGYVQAAANLCVVRDEKLWFYYGAFRGDEKRLSSSWYKNGMYHDGATGVAVLRRDGFVGLKADGKGFVTTRPVVFDGTHLFVNAELAAGGSLSVDLLGADGAVLGSSVRPVTGDSTKTGVALPSALLTSLRNRPVRFRFSLDRGTLYSFWVSPSVRGESRGYVAGGGPDYPSLRDDAPGL